MNLFKSGNTIGSISLWDLGNIITDEKPKLGLPKFQRDAVWDAERVELLWDSIFRFFPFGAFIVANVNENNRSQIKHISRSKWDQLDKYSNGNMTTRSTIEYILLDGQQRANAIALGFQQTENECVWIDIANKEGHYDCRFVFYTCTRAQPWGTRASQQQIYEARDLLFKDNHKSRPPDFKLSLEETWPVAAKTPIPLDVFIMWCKSEKPLEELQRLLSSTNANKFLKVSEAINQERDSIEKLKKIVTTALSKEVPFILSPNVNNDNHDMGVLFTRLNRQGMRMTGEEIFFSSLKVEIPDAHDLVWDIYADKDIGKFLSPSKLVHIGSRIVAKKMNYPVSLESVSDHSFRRLKKDCADFLPCFETFLEQGRFLKIFKMVRYILQYDNTKNQTGLPSPTLQRIKDECWHVLSAWVDWNYDSLNDLDFFVKNREEIIRYVFMETLIWLTVVKRKKHFLPTVFQRSLS